MYNVHTINRMQLILLIDWLQLYFYLSLYSKTWFLFVIRSMRALKSINQSIKLLNKPSSYGTLIVKWKSNSCFNKNKLHEVRAERNLKMLRVKTKWIWADQSTGLFLILMIYQLLFCTSSALLAHTLAHAITQTLTRKNTQT